MSIIKNIQYSGFKMAEEVALTGSSFCEVHSVRFSFMIVCNLRRVGSAIAPAVAAMYRGESAESPSREQNSRVKELATSVHADGLLKIAL